MLFNEAAFLNHAVREAEVLLVHLMVVELIPQILPGLVSLPDQDRTTCFHVESMRKPGIAPLDQVSITTDPCGEP